MRRFVVLAVALAPALHAADRLYESARRKLDLIEEYKAAPGSTIVFTPAEINAWARVEVPRIVPEGIREPRAELGADTATGYALVDLLKMRHAKGQATNWFLAKILEGERPLIVSVRVQSAAGRCTVYLTRVEISRVAATGAVLDFLIKTFFLSLYPNAKINEPFDLDYNIEKIEVRPPGARVTIKKK